MNDDQLPHTDHVVRHVSSRLIDGDEVVGAAFVRKVKDGEIERGLSVNWLECFQHASVLEQMAEVRNRFRRTLRKSHRFAKLNVGDTKHHLEEQLQYFDFREDPLPKSEGHPADPSHSLILGTPEPIPETENNKAMLIGFMIAECVIELYPATSD